MTEEKDRLAKIFTLCWKDSALKDRFMSDPKSVLKEHGVNVPDNLDVKVVNNENHCIHITMPAPPERHHELADEELMSAAGGTSDASYGVVACGPNCQPITPSESPGCTISIIPNCPL